MKLFNYDSPVFNLLSRLTDIGIVGLLWFFTSLPIVTMGAATTAAYDVLIKIALDEDTEVVKKFFKSFVSNFLVSTAAFLLLVVIAALLVFNIRITDGASVLGWLILLFNYFLMYQVVIIAIYIFPLIAKFKMKFFQYIKQASFLGSRHLISSVLHVILLLSLLLLATQFVLLLTVLMGIYCYLSSFIMVKIIRKHRPDFETGEKGDES